MRVYTYSTEEYVQLYQQGKEEGFEYIYFQLHPALSHYAYRWVNDRAIAEDIASDAILRTWKFHANFDNYASIKTYLYTATGRLSQRYIGKEKRKKEILQDTFFKEEDGTTPFDQVVKSETYALIRQAVRKLAPGMRKVMTMHFLEGKKLKEIATELNLSPKTISCQKEQGLKALRKVFIRPLLLIFSLAGYISI